MIRRPPRSTLDRSSAASDVYKRQGLHYENVQQIAALSEISELNIGHAIVARAIFVGFKQAVHEMKQLMLEARE